VAQGTQEERAIMTTGYNYFLYDGTRTLLALLGIDEPTKEQRQQAERVIKDICGYTRSVTGH
jgi:hypothetical protein